VKAASDIRGRSEGGLREGETEGGGRLRS